MLLRQSMIIKSLPRHSQIIQLHSGSLQYIQRLIQRPGYATAATPKQVKGAYMGKKNKDVFHPILNHFFIYRECIQSL